MKKIFNTETQKSDAWHRIFYFPETSRKRLKISKLLKSYCFRYVKVRNLKAIHNNLDKILRNILTVSGMSKLEI